MSPTHQVDAGSGVQEIVVTLTGPGGFTCRGARDFNMPALLPLDRWRPRSDSFSYLSGSTHWTGPYTVTAKYVCDYNQFMGTRRNLRCPPTFDALLGAHHPLADVPTGVLGPIPVTLVRNIEMHIVTFKATGECTMMGKIDCGF